VLHTQYHVNNQGKGKSKGGGQYVFHTTHNDNITIVPGDGYNNTITETTKLIRQGSDTSPDDLHVKFLMHVTVNDQGEITADVFDFESECT
jgi:hypothetical protein